MKTTVTTITLAEIDIATVAVDAKIRYWEDIDVNGKPDICFCDTKGEGEPAMPCAVRIKDAPNSVIYSDHWRWRPTIDIETGRITNWAPGTEARVHYKVCDEFGCTVKDKDGRDVLSYEDYVPGFMYPADEGYGDYIIMNIDKEGCIENWNPQHVISFVQEELRHP